MSVESALILAHREKPLTWKIEEGSTVGERKQVLVCGGVDCKSKDSLAVHDALESALSDSSGIDVTVYACFGECMSGPNVVVFPDKLWYNPVTLADVSELANCLRENRECNRLLGNVNQGLADLIFDLLDSGISGTIDLG